MARRRSQSQQRATLARSSNSFRCLRMAPKEISEPAEGNVSKIIKFLSVFEDGPKEISEPAEGNVSKIIEFLSAFEDGHKEISEPAEGDVSKMIDFPATFK